MNYKKPLIIALIFSFALTALSMTLVYAQSGPSEDEENEEVVEQPVQPRLSSPPDAFGYVYADSNEPGCNTTFHDISGTGTSLGLSSNGETNITTPFPIILYGVTTTTMRIGNNGGLILGTDTGDVYGVNYSLPTTDHGFANGPGVMPFWENLGSSSGHVYIDTIGNAPNRQFIVQWHHRPYIVNTGSTVTFQVIFYENSLNIDFVYYDVFFNSAQHNYGKSATIGINQNGGNALQYSYNTPSILTGANPVSAICFSTSDTLSLQKTVGTDSSVCAPSDTISVTYGTRVYYCYEVTNTGHTTRSLHTLVDSEFGHILNNFSFNLAPGASVWLTETAVITSTTVNTATWTASDPDPAISDSDTATVTVFPESISLAQTVGTDSSVCAPSDAISVIYGTRVYYCYEVTNTGHTTRSLHTLVDSEFGHILNNFPFNLAPGASVWLTKTAVITSTTVNTATWTASNPDPVISDSDSATVTVLPESISLIKTVGTDSSVCAPSDAITVAPGTAVYYCYKVTNNGNSAHTQHTLIDSELGTILNNFSYTLAPGASYWLTKTAVISTTTINTATWTAGTPIPPITATTSATVTVPIVYLPMIVK